MTNPIHNQVAPTQPHLVDSGAASPNPNVSSTVPEAAPQQPAAEVNREIAAAVAAPHAETAAKPEVAPQQPAAAEAKTEVAAKPEATPQPTAASSPLTRFIEGFKSILAAVKEMLGPEQSQQIINAIQTGLQAQFGLGKQSGGFLSKIFG